MFHSIYDFIVHAIPVMGAATSILGALYAADAAYKARMMLNHPLRMSFNEDFVCFNEKLMLQENISSNDIKEFHKVLNKADFYFSTETIEKLDKYRKELEDLHEKISKNDVSLNDSITNLKNAITDKPYKEVKNSLKEEIKETIEIGLFVFLVKKLKICVDFVKSKCIKLGKFNRMR